jgi:predicted dehydrogenase
MALDMTPEQKATGKANFQRVTDQLRQKDPNRREVLAALVGGAAVLLPAAAGYYALAQKDLGKDGPVKAGLIGAGDEGGVLVGEHNPKYLEFIAVADIRPTNRKRIFEDEKLTNPNSPRRGFKFHYGKDAADKIKVYTDYHELLANPNVEAVVIALPLHLHAPVAIAALEAGKHVLCEKLMAWNVTQCKKMIETADRTGKILTIGHQRHYSLLYAQAVEAMKSGVLGDVKHIRALWHRNNTWPKVDANGKPIAGSLTDGWKPDLKDEDVQALKDQLDRYDYKSMEELVRWRLFNRTGGGLMAELGSHQLDACSIFLGKVHPLAVTGVGTKSFYDDHREVDDHVFVNFEFPGPNHATNPNDVVVVTYSSISTNAFENYGECVMGTRGSMVVEKEANIYLWGERDPNLKDGGAPRSTAVSVVSGSGGKPALESSGSTGPAPAAAGAAPAGGAVEGPPSKGYREEMEHFAYCIRRLQEETDHGKNSDPEVVRKWQREPHCQGRVAMADAIIALTSNLAMKHRTRIEFKPEWFDAASPEVPDAEMKALTSKGDEVKL